MVPRLQINPPVLNAACPWATDLSFLRPLYASSSTGAITTRTSLVDGWPHDDAVNTFIFFEANSANSTQTGPQSFPAASDGRNASLNSFGLSPIPLDGYLDMVRTLAREFPRSTKPVIVSVTGTPDSVGVAIGRVAALAREEGIMPLAVEINLSCPNVPGHPPPAYDAGALAEFLVAIPADLDVPVGVKTPPYTHADQFEMLASALAAPSAKGRISFVTATNTLGSCLVMDSEEGNALPSQGGFGGMAGPPIHPLALGNVRSLRACLDARGLSGVDIIGVGGVSDTQGYRRMRAAGARFVAAATALGKKGVAVFDSLVPAQAKL